MRAIAGDVGNARSFDAFDELLNMQAYRLSYWRVASEEINYRRFFDINNLAAIRMELPAVFEATHRFIFELIEKGAINGLRIDHVDGLWLPRDYLEKLQQRTAKVLGAPEGSNPLHLLVEKILLGDERLREDWPVHGTTELRFRERGQYGASRRSRRRKGRSRKRTNLAASSMTTCISTRSPIDQEASW